MTKLDESATAPETGRRTTEIAQHLYEAMERLSDEAPGPPWCDLLDGETQWYRDVAADLLSTFE